MALPREEQETIIRIGFYDDVCTICTSNPTHARHLMKLGLTPDISRVTSRWKEDDNGKRTPAGWEDATWSFEAPADWFKLPKPPRKVSEKQRQAASERFRKARRRDDDDDA